MSGEATIKQLIVMLEGQSEARWKEAASRCDSETSKNEERVGVSPGREAGHAGEEAVAGRCLLFGEYLAGKDLRMHAGYLQLKSQSPVPAGAGQVMHRSGAGRCLRPKAVWELLWSRELMPRGRRDIAQAHQMPSCKNEPSVF